jgi:hypothetical protein
MAAANVVNVSSKYLIFEKDGAPVPGSPGLQAISFNTSCEIEIAETIMQTAGQFGSGVDWGS